MSGRGRGRGGVATRGGRSSPVDLSGGIVEISESPEQTESNEQSSSTRGGRGGSARGGKAPRKQRQLKPLKVVPEPDKAAHEAALASHNTKLATINKQIESFTNKIESLVKSRKAARAAVKSATESLESIRQTKQSHFAEYDRLKVEIETIDNQAINRKKELETLKKSFDQYTSLTELDNAIKQKEKILNSRTLQLSQEREALDELKKLRALRPKLIEFDRKNKEVVAKVDTTELASQRDAAFNAGHACKQDEEKAVAALAEETKKEEKINADLDDLISQRRMLINERQQEEREWLAVLDEYNAQMKVYEVYRKEKDWRDNEEARRAQSQREFEQRQARREAKALRKFEYEQRKADWAAEQARIVAERDPYEEEKQIVDDLARYLSNLAIKYGVSLEDSADGSADSGSASEESLRLAAERAAAFNGKSAKPLQKSEKKDSAIPELVAKKQTDQKAAKPKQAKGLSHITDVFRLFTRISVEPPVLSSDIPAAHKAVLAKGEFYANAPRPASSTQDAEEEAAPDSDAEEEDVQVTTSEQ